MSGGQFFMKILTDYVGEIEFKESDIITFMTPMYGFAESKRFILVGTMTEEFPFVWLQSIDEEQVAFLVTNPFFFKEGYDFNINELDMDELGIADDDDIEIAATVVIPNEVKDATMNLKSPIVINYMEKIAKQIILDEDYPYKYKLFSQTEG